MKKNGQVSFLIEIVPLGGQLAWQLNDKDSIVPTEDFGEMMTAKTGRDKGR